MEPPRCAAGSEKELNRLPFPVTTRDTEEVCRIRSQTQSQAQLYQAQAQLYQVQAQAQLRAGQAYIQSAQAQLAKGST